MQRSHKNAWFWLTAITLLGLGLRLLAWRWREFYPLGGDEQEYFNQALTLLRERQYVELRLMRPPLYTIFLAGCIYLFDSFVQHIRLVQALISTATIPLIFLATRAAAQHYRLNNPERPALLAALLCALSYSLAVNATELLTEALFLFGLSAVIWLLISSARSRRILPAFTAGLIVGALCLVRSVALPLLPLGSVWLALQWMQFSLGRRLLRTFIPAAAFALAVILVVAPWSTRNYLTYGGMIIIDTTGAENLWLDNDPAGREAVKAQLYALEEDRLLRQQRSTENGIAVIQADPERFAQKMLGELYKFFALEFSDDLRNRPVIWVPPAEVALRLIAGDGIWLMTLWLGSYGLLCGIWMRPRRISIGRQSSGSISSTRINGELITTDSTPSNGTSVQINLPKETALDRLVGFFRTPSWLLLPWAGYVLLTTLIFHVELRYRLPLYPALLPFAALTLSGAWKALDTPRWLRRTALIVPLLAIILMLQHRNYPALAWQLGNKHLNLALAEAALRRNDPAAAEAAASSALNFDERSALARTALAQAALFSNDRAIAMQWLNEAIAAMPDHPYAHLLRGDLLRDMGETEAARSEFIGYERASLQDLQTWSWERFISPAPNSLDIGGGLDLGFVQGFHSVAANDNGYRWTTAHARLRMEVPAGSRTVRLRIAGGPPQRGTIDVRVAIAGSVQTISVTPEWSEQEIPLPDNLSGQQIEIVISAPTFTPRDYDPASPDGRTLGVMLDSAIIE